MFLSAVGSLRISKFAVHCAEFVAEGHTVGKFCFQLWEGVAATMLINLATIRRRSFRCCGHSCVNAVRLGVSRRFLCCGQQGSGATGGVLWMLPRPEGDGNQFGAGTHIHTHFVIYYLSTHHHRCAVLSWTLPAHGALRLRERERYGSNNECFPKDFCTSSLFTHTHTHT